MIRFYGTGARGSIGVTINTGQFAIGFEVTSVRDWGGKGWDVRLILPCVHIIFYL